MGGSCVDVGGTGPAAVPRRGVDPAPAGCRAPRLRPLRFRKRLFGKKVGRRSSGRALTRRRYTAVAVTSARPAPRGCRLAPGRIVRSRASHHHPDVTSGLALLQHGRSTAIVTLYRATPSPGGDWAHSTRRQERCKIPTPKSQLPRHLASSLRLGDGNWELDWELGIGGWELSSCDE